MRACIFLLTFLNSVFVYAQSCEVYYSFDSHPNGVTVLGKDIIDGKSSLKLKDWSPFMRQEDNRLDTILENIPGFTNTLRIGKGTILQGGYKGKTQLSLRRDITLSDAADENTVLALAAIIGYIYVQDSVLVICDDNSREPDNNTVFKHEISDVGKQRYFNSGTASILYGILLGKLDNLESMGYSYDLEKRIYMVLEFSEDNQIKNTLADVTDDITSLYSGNIKLKIETSNVDVFFPDNNWLKQKDGQNYLSMLDKRISPVTLKKEQKIFIQNLRVFLAGVMNNKP